MNEDLVEFIDQSIEDNKDVLLSSFGLYGISRSDLKLDIIMDIVNNTKDMYKYSENDTDYVYLFFSELKEYYTSDPQFKVFVDTDIAEFIAEERAYVLHEYQPLAV